MLDYIRTVLCNINDLLTSFNNIMKILSPSCCIFTSNMSVIEKLHVKFSAMCNKNKQGGLFAHLSPFPAKMTQPKNTLSNESRW